MVNYTFYTSKAKIGLQMRTKPSKRKRRVNQKRRKKRCVSAVVRDKHGLVVAASIKKVNYVLNIGTTKALDVLNGVKLALNLGFSKVCFEGYSKVALRFGIFSLHKTATVINDIQLLCSIFLKSEFAFVKHEVNNVAHTLTREVFKSGDRVWWDLIPASIANDIVIAS